MSLTNLPSLFPPESLDEVTKFHFTFKQDPSFDTNWQKLFNINSVQDINEFFSQIPVESKVSQKPKQQFEQPSQMIRDERPSEVNPSFCEISGNNPPNPQTLQINNSQITSAFLCNSNQKVETQFVDVTPFLVFPQHVAAKKIGIPPSTLAKRWKEASLNRKWPYRTIAKLDKEIHTLLQNVNEHDNSTPIPAHIESALVILLKKRETELKPVVVRII